MKSISLVCSCLIFGSLLWNCGSTTESKTKFDSQKREVISAVSPTPEIERMRPASDSLELCKQLAEMKKFPGRDPSEEEDPFYAAIMAKGKEILPCLVDEITNETPMDDPRSAPAWQHYKVGDTAVFLLARMAKSTEILKEMLPPTYREEWKTNSVYAYFNYVSTTENRRQLQKWWRERLAKDRKK